MQRGWLISSQPPEILKSAWRHSLLKLKACQNTCFFWLLLDPFSKMLFSHIFIFKIVYAANLDSSSRALPHLWIHNSQVSFTSTVLENRSLSGHSTTKTVTIFYKSWSIVVIQHLDWYSSRTRRDTEVMQMEDLAVRALTSPLHNSVRFRNTSQWASTKRMESSIRHSNIENGILW